MPSPKTDWEAIEREYRAGQLSVREIARQYAVSDTAVRKRAKSANWERLSVHQVRSDGSRSGSQDQQAEEAVCSGERQGGERPVNGGRPSAYQDDYAKEAMKLCALGATDLEVADFFEINVSTLYRWQAKYLEFCEALKVGKDACDDRVERSLYHRAVGYTHDAVKVFQFQGAPVIVPYREHVAPDVSAATLWLKNRRKDVWRDKQDHEFSGAIEIKRIERVVIDSPANSNATSIPSASKAG